MITYALLSPTFGMHQYTADLARRVQCDLGNRTRLVTTSALPPARYLPGVQILTPVHHGGTGFSREGLAIGSYRQALQALQSFGQEGPVHFTGVHLWNAPLVFALRRRSIHVIHSLHDLAPHGGVRHAGLIRLWNRLIIASGATILVHGKCYRDQLLARGVSPERVAYTPLLHGFWGWEAEGRVRAMELEAVGVAEGRDQKRKTADELAVIFFGRLERYKGVDTLLNAWARLVQVEGGRPGLEAPRLILAGRRANDLTLPVLPPRVELHDRRITDEDALDLFGRSALLVLPYRDGTQSALVAAAARLGIPSLVTHTGALPEYVTDGLTGWTVPAADAGALTDALLYALDDRERLRRMGRAAHDWYESARLQELETLAALYSAGLSSANAAEAVAYSLFA